MRKKTYSALLGAAVCAALLAGSGQTMVHAKTAEAETTEEATAMEAEEDITKEKIVGAYYEFSYPVEGMDDMVQFFHFYGDDIGIGATFYVSYAWNQVTFSGTYTVEEKEFDYEVKEDKDGENVKGTAPYTITFFDMDGNELDQAGYDGDYVYNTTTTINTDPMTGGGQYRMQYADEEILAKYADTFGGEVGTAYMKFIDPNDGSSFVTLNTNGTYEDMVIMAVDGTWSVDDKKETYTLNPVSEDDNGATIKVQKDGTFLYTSDDETEVTLEEDAEAEEAMKFTGTIKIQDMDADLVITTYTDDTCKATASMAGMEMDIDQGTYEVGSDGFTYTFNFENAGEIVSELGGETGVQVHYVQAGNDKVGDVDTMLSVVLPQ